MKKYKTILIDPPWKINFKSCASGDYKKQQYKTMDIEQIKNLPISKLSDETCNLFLWTTHTFLPESFELLKAWGFLYNGIITWDKGSGLVHFGLQRRTEFCLHGFKNQKDIEASGQSIPSLIEDLPDLFREKRTMHSKKPERFYRILEKKTEGPRLELFARQKKAGWDVWGNQIQSEQEVSDILKTNVANSDSFCTAT